MERAEAPVIAYGYRVDEVLLPDPGEPKPLKLKVHDSRGDSYRPAVSTSLGCHVVGAKLPHVDPSHVKTSFVGAVKRFCGKTPDPDPEVWQRLLGFVDDLVKEFEPLKPDTDLTLDTWLFENTTYSQKRKQELRRVAKKSIDRMLLWCKSFIKDEEYTQYKHARTINSRSDLFKTMTGPLFHQIEKVMFRNKHFIKYVPVPERPSYIKKILGYLGCKYAETDWTACEAHFDRVKFEIEFKLYRHMVRYIPDGLELLRFIEEALTGEQRCSYKFMTIVLQVAARMSGEMNTSLGNGFANFALSSFFGREFNFKGIFEGDDGALAGRAFPTSDDFRAAGFRVDLEPVGALSEISFCGLVFDEEDLVIITDPIPELLSFGWSKQPYVRTGKKTLMSLLRAKSISMLYQYPRCPILRELALYGLRVTRSYSTDRILKFMNAYEKEQFLEARAWFSKQKLVDIMQAMVPSNTRHLMASKYGIPVEFQFRIEELLRSKEGLSPINDSTILCFVHKDCIDYYQKYVFKFRSFKDEYYYYPPVPFVQIRDAPWPDHQ